MNPTDLEHHQNTGLIAPAPRPTDYVAGVESAITYEALVADGDWEKYRSSDEWQRRFKNGVLGYDTQSCTDFSALNSIELQIERMLQEGLINDAGREKMEELGYFDENGKVNFNDWFNAKTAGTTLANGNTLQAPWDAVRKYGLIGQSKGPGVNDFKTGDAWFAEPVTAEQYELGLEFLKLFNVKYEWAIVSGNGLANDPQYAYHLKQAPLHIATPTCGTWNGEGVVGKCDPYRQLNHATCRIGSYPDGGAKDLDHYNPFVKHLAADYYMPYAIKGVVTIKPSSTYTPSQIKYVFAKKLVYEYLDDAATKINPAVKNDADEVRKLQTVLQFLKRTDGTPYMKPGVFGRFGPATRTALSLFQKDHAIVDPDLGKNFGPQTRAAVNALLV